MMSQAQKEKISQTQQRRYAEIREAYPPPALERKRCSKCREWKWAHWSNSKQSDFSFSSRLLACGERVRKPSSWCKPCQAKYRKERQDAKTPEERSAEHKRWNNSRDKDRARVYHREYSDRRRREAGAPIRGQHKRILLEGEERPTRVSVNPLGDWFSRNVRFSTTLQASALGAGSDVVTQRAICERAGVSDDILRRVLAKRGSVTIEQADALLIAIGAQDQLSILYPL